MSQGNGKDKNENMYMDHHYLKHQYTKQDQWKWKWKETNHPNRRKKKIDTYIHYINYINVHTPSTYIKHIK